MGMKSREPATVVAESILKEARSQGIEAATTADDTCDLDNYMNPEEPYMEPSDLCSDYWDHMHYQDEILKMLPDASEAQKKQIWREFLGAFLQHCKKLYPAKAHLVK